MCGIIGYVGPKGAQTIVLEGLKKLEYRGYDSWGVAAHTGDDIQMVKKVGKIGEATLDDSMESALAIGHTRWATHGGVTEENAHPHLSADGDICVVHNGVVENYQELRDRLKVQGFEFKSETDTEVIPHLIDHYMTRGMKFFEAAKLALQDIEGSYAVVALHKTSRQMVAARRGSPLVIGIGNNEYFAASDIPAFLEHTKNVMYLHDYDFVEIDNGIKVYNLKTGAYVQRPIDTIAWDVEQAEKGDFEHYMLKEIAEQAETIRSSLNQSKNDIEFLANEIRNAKGVFFVGCGTSSFAALTGSYLFSKIANMHVNIVQGSEFAYHKHFLKKESLVIAISQSGETADIIDAVKAAKEKGAKVLAIVNVVGSTLTRYADHSIIMNAGPEICVVATKSYTSQVSLLTLLAYAVAGRYDEGKDRLKLAYNEVYNLTSSNARKYLHDLAIRLKDSKNIFLLGRGLQYPTALEAALKIKEVSYIHAEGFAGGELKHGTIALIEKGTPCIVFVSEENKKETISNAMEIKARGGYIIGIGAENNEAFDFFVKTPEVHEQNPILQIIPTQILAYQLAVLRGCDPDKPRNLAKSVTVR